MKMSSNNGKITPEIRNSGTRQIGGIVPAPDRSVTESCEGPSGELPASSLLDMAIASGSSGGDKEQDFVVAIRPSPKKRSARGSNPRVAVTKVDKEIRIVPGPPPSLNPLKCTLELT